MEDEEEFFADGRDCEECGRLVYDPEYIDPWTCKACARQIEGDADDDEDEDE